MNALVFHKSIPKYLLLKTLGARWRSLSTGSASPVRLEAFSGLTLPSPRWVCVKPRLAGICGSDLAAIGAKGSAYLAPLTSMPFVLGHEVVGTVADDVGSAVARVSPGDRVVLRPALGCKVREIDPLCEPCAQGMDALCHNVTRGLIGPGIQTGYCKDTGGAFSDLFLAHESQLYKVPAELSDESAVLIEPFSCAIHSVLKAETKKSDTVLVISCGTMGLLTIAALRASGCASRIVAVGRYEHQRRHAENLGADVVLGTEASVTKRYRTWSKVLNAEVLKAELGKAAVIGGADIVFDCVASSQSIDDGVRFTRSGGTFVLVGMPGIPYGVDWTPIWFKELTLRAAYAYGVEYYQGTRRDTFELAIDWMREWKDKLTPLVGTPYPLEQYRKAFAAAQSATSGGAIKTVFAMDTT